jgi:hypothetical protein
MAWEALVSRYGVARAIPWLLIDLVVLAIVAVPVYVALQVALTFVGAQP